MARIAELPGLQAQRTLLAWDRTALGLLANGALLLFRDTHSVDPVRLATAAGAVVVALLCALTGHRRARRIGRPTTTVAAPSREVAALGVTVAVLGLMVILLLALR